MCQTLTLSAYMYEADARGGPWVYGQELLVIRLFVRSVSSFYICVSKGRFLKRIAPLGELGLQAFPILGDGWAWPSRESQQGPLESAHRQRRHDQYEA